MVLGDLLTFSSELNHPGSFLTFVASGTSIWWNERSVLKDEPSFVRKSRPEKPRREC
jgi:predicted alpha/beta superfamily hydrolase